LYDNDVKIKDNGSMIFRPTLVCQPYKFANQFANYKLIELKNEFLVAVGGWLGQVRLG